MWCWLNSKDSVTPLNFENTVYFTIPISMHLKILCEYQSAYQLGLLPERELHALSV